MKFKLLTCPNCNSISVLVKNYIDFEFKCDCKVTILIYSYSDDFYRIGRIEKDNITMRVYTDHKTNSIYFMIDNSFININFEIFNYYEINDDLLSKYFKFFTKFKDNLLFY